MESRKINGIIVFMMVLLANSHWVAAQHARFVNSGNITFEKRVNMFAVLTKRYSSDKSSSFMKEALDQYKRSQPQFQTFQASLAFNKNASLYQPIESTTPSGGFFGNDPSINLKKIIYTDFKTSISTSQKSLYEETYVVEDTTRKIQWKLTSETREIAGYTCRRANALIMDSIYVVAFYTDQIPVSGGPDSFTGLPGMILGLALPHENTTWFATNVQDVNVPTLTMPEPPKKSKKLNNQSLLATLKESLSNWGEYAQYIFKAMLL